MSLCKYYKQKRIVSYDDGNTWQDVSPAEYQVGGLYEIDSADCSEGESIIRWVLVPGDYLCEGKNKYQKEIEQYSTDNGLTWFNVYPATYRKGLLIEPNSIICNNKWEGHYTEETDEPTISCPSGQKWVDGVGCVSIDPIKFVRCETSSSTTLTQEEVNYSTYSLMSGTIGDCVTNIGISAFNGCSNLTGITIPNSVTTISGTAFAGCSSLTSINIPNSVTSIGSSAFQYCSGLTNVNLGSGVTRIHNSAFADCSGLTSIAIPDSVTSIYNETFQNCRSLTSVTIGNGITSIGSGVFNRCINLKSIDIPSGVTSIGSSAFAYCRSLSSCTIGSGVTSIYTAAFEYCSGLTSIDIPNSVTSIEQQAFYNCSSLTAITVNAVTPPTLGYAAFSNTNNCPIYVPCNTINTYKSTAGWSNYADRIVEIPNSCTFQGKFKATYTGGTTYSAECDSSTELTTATTKPSGYQYSAMTEAVIGDCNTSIGNNAFNGCSSLTSIVIPNSVTSIGSIAFNNCTGLTSINIPNSVTSIGQYTFLNCRSLTSIDIPNSVTTIDTQTFSGCRSLTSCTIGSGVTSIGNGVFLNCSGLTSITVNATTPPTLGSSVFSSTPIAGGTGYIYVPSASVNTYKSASGWSDYASRIQAIP